MILQGVHQGATDIHLTSREFALLEVLARTPGSLHSKAGLLEQVWGLDFEGSANIVEVYVGYLRRKLDVDGSPSLIATVRGHGYRLVP